MSVHLILGGARSGKSAFAQTLAGQMPGPVVVIATAEARDAEMAARIARHQADRPAHWQTRETPVSLAAALHESATQGGCVLVDCLTLWLLNLLEAGETVFAKERHALLDTLPTLPGEIILVSNEIGLGVMPMGELTRRFVDEAGRLNQAVAVQADAVTLIAAGLPLVLKNKDSNTVWK